MEWNWKSHTFLSLLFLFAAILIIRELRRGGDGVLAATSAPPPDDTTTSATAVQPNYNARSFMNPAVMFMPSTTGDQMAGAEALAPGCSGC